MFAEMFCPKVDGSGASIWVQAFPGYELVVVTSTQGKETGTSLLAGERTFANNGSAMMSVEVGSAEDGLWSIAFDRSPKEGDTVGLSFRVAPPEADAQTTPPTTFRETAQLAAERYSYTFTGGRFESTGDMPVCKGR